MTLKKRVDPPRALQPDAMAFVIQLQPGGDADDMSFRGRVEHLASGAEARFGCVDDLVAFIRRLIAQQPRGRE